MTEWNSMLHVKKKNKQTEQKTKKKSKKRRANSKELATVFRMENSKFHL